MKKKSYEIHVISNTHWDREWLYDFQETRMMLIEFFDRLLDILDREPDYASYLLDGQAVPVEDYLEVRPEARTRLAAHVVNGRLHIGPWYTDPECFNVNGESLVRNLLYGHRVARELGGVMKVGYTPFSYGQNSQMPQIYQGFGIDTMLFYHGVSHTAVENEFIFEGADGTRILGSQMSSGARYNFYHNVYRPVVRGKSIDERMHMWPDGGLPFHLCGPNHVLEHHFFLDPVNTFGKDKLKPSVDTLLQSEKDACTTPFLAFMDGHDSSVADVVTLRLIEEAQRLLGKDTIFHSNLPALMAKVKAAAANVKLTVLEGERRVPAPMGARMHLYSDVTSGRTRMKRLNSHAEHLLQRWAEPYASIASSLGSSYPATLLDLAWKTLLKCHAHDSIAGSGVDDIERDMYDRLRQVTNTSTGLLRRSLADIQLRIDNSDVAKDDVLLTVFNPSPYPRADVVTAAVDLPATSGYGTFRLVEKGAVRTEAPLQLVSRKPHHAVMNHAADATYMMACEQAVFHFDTGEVPALGYATYRLERKQPITASGLVQSLNTMENEYLHVRIAEDGTLTLTHKATRATFESLHYFEDGGEAGHAWMHIEPALDRMITSRGRSATISLEENGPLLARYRIAYRMEIPAGLDPNGEDVWKRLDGAGGACCRTEATREFEIVSFVTLRKGANSVDITTRFDNRCNNHRLRVMFPTYIKADVCHVESAFDVVEREIDFGPGSPWHGAPVPPTFPMQRFVDVNGRKAGHRTKVGLAVINDGLREYEVTPKPEHTIAVTLLRAYEVALTTVSKRWEIHPEMRLSQCPGEHEFRYSIYPHAGGWDDAAVYRESERLALPLEIAQAGPHAGDLPKRQSFLSLEPANLILSAMKQSEDGSGALVIRVFNPTGKTQNGRLKFNKRVGAAEVVNLEESKVRTLSSREHELKITLNAKQILTFKVLLSR